MVPPGHRSPIRPSAESHRPGAIAAPTARTRLAQDWKSADIGLTLVALWIASLVRVLRAGGQHEVFGVEASLAFLSLVLVPFILFRSRFRSQRSSLEGAPRPRKSGSAGRGLLRLVDGTEPGLRAAPAPRND